jgi:hypothetical protein
MTPGFWASLNGLPVHKLALVIPAVGLWHADVEVAEQIDAAGPQVLIVSGTTYTCAAYRTTDFAGTHNVRLVGGTGGWRKFVPPKQYQSPAGVPTSVVLSDVAATVQEIPPVVDPSVSPTIGPMFMRQGGSASLVLWQLLGNAWYMDPTGTIQTAPRFGVPIATPFQTIEVHGCPGVYEVVTDNPESWVPGMTFVSPTVTTPVTVSRVMHTASGEAFKTEVMASP